jgi:type IV pilus assembly protein PilM
MANQTIPTLNTDQQGGGDFEKRSTARVLERLIEDEEMRQRVLLAALPKYQWQALCSEWEIIGFKPKVVDLAADGLARLYSQLALNGKSKKNTAELEAPLDLAIVELSADRVEFILLEHGVFFLYSDLEVSLNDMNNRLSRNPPISCGNASIPLRQTRY